MVVRAANIWAGQKTDSDEPPARFPFSFPLCVQSAVNPWNGAGHIQHWLPSLGENYLEMPSQTHPQVHLTNILHVY